MELRVGKTNPVYFEGDSTWGVTASWSKDGAVQGNLTTAYEGDRWTATLPYMVNEARVSVTWTFTVPVTGTLTKTETFDIVTPLLTTRELKEIHPNGTQVELDRIESAVRHIINAHTGQTFGQFQGTKSVRSNNTKALHLPARLQKLTSVNGRIDSNTYFNIEGDGFVLTHFPWGVPPVKADYYGLHQHVGGVIHNPNYVKTGGFPNGFTFSIEGLWGWDMVPTPVKEAARLLVNDYACQDANYRDRYLSSVTAADWRIQYNSGAFARTGNVRADQLLQDYVLKLGWAVV